VPLNSDGTIHVEFSIVNLTPVDAIDNVIDLRICDQCKYAKEPVGFVKLPGYGETGALRWSPYHSRKGERSGHRPRHNSSGRSREYRSGVSISLPYLRRSSRKAAGGDRNNPHCEALRSLSSLESGRLAPLRLRASTREISKRTRARAGRTEIYFRFSFNDVPFLACKFRNLVRCNKNAGKNLAERVGFGASIRIDNT